MLSVLKNMIADDVKKIFLNEDELADRHIIDGIEIECIVDDSIDNVMGLKSMQYAEGVNITSKILFIKEGYIEYPDIGQQIELDGNLYSVKKAIDNMGMYEILLEAYDS